MEFNLKIFGWNITKAAPVSVSPVPSSRGWMMLVRDWFAGAWQRNQEWSVDTVASHHAVYACITLISNDVGKLRPKLVEQDIETGIWSETESPAFSPVLRKPNHYQTRIQFIEWWVLSKLLRGNAYALKQRDNRGVVRRLYLLDPSRVTVLVASDGGVYYQLDQDELSGVVGSQVSVPASEIIHDRMNCLFHPLVGISPIYACGLAAHMGLRIQNNSADFFANGSNPSGILTGPMEIGEETATMLKDRWDSSYGGENSGKVAVLGSNLKFEPLRMSAVDSQLIDQLKWSAEQVCSTFHVPAFKIGLGQMPTYQNGQILNQIYYSDCLQSMIEQFELCMDEGLGLDEVLDSGRQLGVELDLDALLRMDTATQVETLAKGVQGALYTPNEARKKLDLPPKQGGDTPYLQQQNYSIAALDERDRNNPFEKPATPAALPPGSPPDDEPPPTDGPPPPSKALDIELFRKELRENLRRVA